MSELFLISNFCQNISWYLIFVRKWQPNSVQNLKYTVAQFSTQNWGEMTHLCIKFFLKKLYTHHSWQIMINLRLVCKIPKHSSNIHTYIKIMYTNIYISDWAILYCSGLDIGKTNRVVCEMDHLSNRDLFRIFHEFMESSLCALWLA